MARGYRWVTLGADQWQVPENNATISESRIYRLIAKMTDTMYGLTSIFSLYPMVLYLSDFRAVARFPFPSLDDVTLDLKHDQR